MLLCFVPKLLVRAEFLTAILESYSLYPYLSEQLPEGLLDFTDGN